MHVYLGNKNYGVYVTTVCVCVECSAKHPQITNSRQTCLRMFGDILTERIIVRSLM